MDGIVHLAFLFPPCDGKSVSHAPGLLLGYVLSKYFSTVNDEAVQVIIGFTVFGFLFYLFNGYVVI